MDTQINDSNKCELIECAENVLSILNSGGNFYDLIYTDRQNKMLYNILFQNIHMSVDDIINNNFDDLEKQIVLKIKSLSEK